MSLAKRSTFALLLATLLGCSSPGAPKPGQDGGASGPERSAPRAQEPKLPPPPVKIVAGGPSDAAVAAANAFAVDLHGKLRSTAGNLAYSPASIAIALSMTSLGALGETATEMRKVLHLDHDTKAIHGGFATVLASYQEEPERDAPIIRMVNRLFGEKTLALEPAFSELAGGFYGAPLDPSDFLGAPAAEQKRINDWVAEQTAGRIANLLPEGALDARTKLVLTNAVYFKGGWMNAFDRTATRPEPFKGEGGKTTGVPMMHDAGAARFGTAEGVTLLELGYVGGRFAALFVLPNDVAGLGDVEEQLTDEALRGWVAALAYEQVDMALPRFKIDPPQTMQLKPILEALVKARARFRYPKRNLVTMSP